MMGIQEKIRWVFERKYVGYLKENMMLFLRRKKYDGYFRDSILVFLDKIWWAFERKYDGYLKENMTGIRKKIFWLSEGKFEGYFVWFDDEIKADEGKIFCWPFSLAQKCCITLKYKDESAKL